MKIFLRIMRAISTRYRPAAWFAFDTLVQSREVRLFPAGSSSGTRISERCLAKAVEHSIANIHESCTFTALQNILLLTPTLAMKHRGMFHQHIKLKDIP